MDKLLKKNYISLFILIIFTIFITLFLSHLYLSREKLTSQIYQYSNKIQKNELDSFLIENSDAIIYISDRYDLENEIFEKEFINKIEKNNLKDKLVYIDVDEISKKDIQSIKKTYNVTISKEEYPNILIISDRKIIKNIKVDKSMNVDEIMNYEVFE